MTAAASEAYAEPYVPAAGRVGITALYDLTVGLTMREDAWRPAFARAAVSGESATEVLDLGCGTGAVTVELARAAPSARVVGIDGDARVLARARRRVAGHSGVELIEGLADALPFEDDAFDRATCSLLLHHLGPATQRAALAELSRVLRPGGELHLADWGRPRGVVLRAGSLLLRCLDGFPNTGPAVHGELPAMVEAAGFAAVTITRRLRTVWGALELLRCRASG